ncbi:hypothetical protein KIP88_02725 [Bradyrhizobium sp. SRL28]|uniref:hypothetical protein n=1 Tax=Bradyrhizobium sp. SRL28 TaxID=2836178 RepID=UPI001BDE477C|nr:hypothetical protein [Bradyrhizobium sp. SRL28]MBT1509405.1 hypothetical protein [Bradyrhizobium sp. SRL28]
MAEFEELRLTVSLVDNASAGLSRLRSEFGQLINTTNQMAAGITASTTAVVAFGNASATAAPQVRAANVQMRELQRAATDTGRALSQMGMLAKQGFSGMPQMAILLWDASRGVSQMAQGMAAISPTARVATLALGGITLGVVAVGAAAIAYGVSVFRMAKEMDALEKTSKTLGISFATLKGAQDQAKAVGESADTVTRNFQGIQAAQLDLFNRNSQLKNKLLTQGVGEEWIKAFSTAEPREAFNMIRSFSKRLEKSLTDQGWTTSAAAAMAAQFAQEFGVTVGDLPELKPLSPEAAADMERVKVLSVEVMEVWNPLSVKLEKMALEGLHEELPYLVEALKHTDAIIEQIKIEMRTVGQVFKTIKWVFDMINHPIDTLTKLSEDQETKDKIVDFLDPAIRRHLAPVTRKPGGAQKFADIGPSGGGGEPDWAGGGGGRDWSWMRRSENIEDRRDEAQSPEGLLADATENDVTETGKLTQQLARLNSFFDRQEAQSLGGGGTGAGGGSGGGGSGLALFGGGAAFSGGGGNYGGASRGERGGGGSRSGDSAAPAETSRATVTGAQDSSARYGDTPMRTSGARGKINDNDLYKNLYNNVPSELIGVVPKDGARFGIKTGSREEWAKLQFKLAQQESGGSTTPASEAGHTGTAGLYQFEQKDLDRWGGKGKVTDPNAQIRAMNNVFKKKIIEDNAIGGQDSWPGRSNYGAGAYFGPLRDAGVNRGRIARHEAAGERVAAANRAELDRASTTTANNPSVTGGLKAEVDAPAGTKVEVSGTGPFKNTETTRRIGPTVERAAELAKAN